MKKYFYIMTGVLFVLLTACDYNERNFPGLDELSCPENLYEGAYELTEADYPALIVSVNASGETEAPLWVAALKRDKAFSDEAPADRMIPHYLKKMYYAVDLGSVLQVSYPRLRKSDAVLSALAKTPYVVTSEDYQSIWGDPYAEVFTPSHTPAQALPGILAAAGTEPDDGMFRCVEYYCSEEEPIPSNVEQTLLEEDFEAYTTVNAAITLNGWTQYQESGTYTFQAKTFNSNWYAQISNGSSGKRKTWLISPEIDLSALSFPQFTFDAKVGYYTSTCLEIKVSVDYKGGDDPTTASWSDITSSFSLPVSPASGYGDDFENTGNADLATYAGRKVYIAFRYNGDADATPAQTTTYQLDNIRLFETIPGIEAPERSLRYGIWYYDGEAARWKQTVPEILPLQPEDYTAMGLSYLNTEQAPLYLPVWLSGRFPYAQQGDQRVVVFKTAADATAALRLIFSDGHWVVESPVISATGQFILSTAGWIFDPTVVVDFTGEEYQVVVDYVIRTHAVTNSALVHKNNNAEYYYGFAAYYGNVTYRESDRKNDPLYPLEGSDAEKTAFMDARTIEGLSVYLAETRPQLQPDVNGVEQLARLTVVIYNDPTADRQNIRWSYTFRCTAPGTWEFVGREADK